MNKQLDGDKLKAARVARSLTQRDAAKAIGITPQALCNYERGHATPSADVLLSILAYYRLTNYDVTKENTP